MRTALLWLAAALAATGARAGDARAAAWRRDDTAPPKPPGRRDLRVAREGRAAGRRRRRAAGRAGRSLRRREARAGSRALSGHAGVPATDAARAPVLDRRARPGGDLGLAVRRSAERLSDRPHRLHRLHEPGPRGPLARSGVRDAEETGRGEARRQPGRRTDGRRREPGRRRRDRVAAARVSRRRPRRSAGSPRCARTCAPSWSSTRPRASGSFDRRAATRWAWSPAASSTPAPARSCSRRRRRPASRRGQRPRRTDEDCTSAARVAAKTEAGTPGAPAPPDDSDDDDEDKPLPTELSRTVIAAVDGPHPRAGLRLLRALPRARRRAADLRGRRQRHRCSR